MKRFLVTAGDYRGHEIMDFGQPPNEHATAQSIASVKNEGWAHRIAALLNDRYEMTLEAPVVNTVAPAPIVAPPVTQSPVPKEPAPRSRPPKAKRR